MICKPKFLSGCQKFICSGLDVWQLDLNLERLRMAVDDLLVKLAKMFPKPKQQIVFLINNYDVAIAVLKVRPVR